MIHQSIAKWRRARVAASVFSLFTALPHRASAAPTEPDTGRPTEPDTGRPTEPEPDPSATARKIEPMSYGWQTLLLDLGAIATMAGAAGEKDPSNARALAGVSISTYALGPPLVHALHGNGQTALKSGAMRLVLPPAGALVGACGGALLGLVAGVAVGTKDQAGSGWDGLAGFVLGMYVGGATGFGVGYVGAVVVDAAKFSYDEPPAPAKQAQAASRPSAWTLEPRVSISPKGGAQLGIGGAF